MKKQGIYQTDLGIGNGWIHFGSKNGEPFSQLSFIDIGDMNNDCIKTELDGNQIIITVMLNDMPSSIQIDTETEKGVFDVFSIGFHKEFIMAGTAIITGSSRGIGAAIAKRLAKDGYNIVINDVSQEILDAAGKEVAEECRSFGVEAECYAADVSDYAQCEGLVKWVKERFGTIDVLINNAGITRDGLMAQMSEENYDLVIRVNQKSVFNMTKLAGKVMIRQRSGRIVNLASVAGLYGNPGQMNYSASKGAIIAMTKTTAKELGSRGITCNAVAPGFIQTPMTDKLTEDQRNAMLAQIAMKRYGQPEEIAGVVSFLCSPDSSYVTGQIIEISGGLSM